MSAAPYVHLISHTEQGVLVLTLTDAEIRGDDLGDALTQELIAAITPLERPRLVIDFQRVSYLSSVGLRAILTVRRHLREKGGEMLLCGLSEPVTHVLQTARLVTTSPSSTVPFTMVPDVPAAIAQLK